MNRNQGIAIVIAIVVLGGFFISEQKFSFLSGNDKNNQMNSQTASVGDTQSGLKIEDMTVGTGKEALPGLVVSVQYTGTFKDGKKFDSSYDRGEPIKFTLGTGQVIQGWDKGLVGMKVGGKRHIEIPPELGYGPNDFPSSANPIIPGGSTLIFDVELVAVESDI